MSTAVIGAGAAGLMAAGTALSRGLDVILIEKNNRPGRKLLITGKGRCNLTNDTDIDGLVAGMPGNGFFLYSAFNRFSAGDIISFFESRGVPLKTERGGRVFPVSDSSKDIIDALISYTSGGNLHRCYSSRAAGIKTIDGRVEAVVLENGENVCCTSAILATGGYTYPATGSTGDGYSIASGCGHTISQPKPSLVPLITSEDWPASVEGLSLRNVGVRFTDSNSRVIFSDFGEMMFTDFGVTGPVILSAGHHLAKLGYSDVRLHIDLKPALDIDTLDKRIARDFLKNSRKYYRNSLDELLPSGLIPVIISLSRLDPIKKVNQISREERKNLAGLLKDLTLTIKAPGSLSEAIITAGGVVTDEINPATMESKIIKGLFFAGEVIDVDGYTGGYNLSAAFSTGYTAGSCCY